MCIIQEHSHTGKYIQRGDVYRLYASKECVELPHPSCFVHRNVNSPSLIVHPTGLAIGMLSENGKKTMVYHFMLQLTTIIIVCMAMTYQCSLEHLLIQLWVKEATT